ncbi:MAG TPA: cytochrome c [Steroidobacteraceae bacterium]|nr:cytochrome c [Steroidobacteraceae bacterium]
MPSLSPSCIQFRALAAAASLWLALAIHAPAHAAGDAQRGKVLAYTCLGCHGIENYKSVYPTYNVPRLAGQNADYIVVALKAYKARERSNGTMYSQASSLSDQDMQDVAAYLSGMAVKSTGTVIGTTPDKVTQLCASCHGRDGIGLTSTYPSLTGQHADYLERALLDYKLGNRKNLVMGTFVNTLNEADIKVIADYYSKQQPALQTVYRRTWLFSAQR